MNAKAKLGLASHSGILRRGVRLALVAGLTSLLGWSIGTPAEAQTTKLVSKSGDWSLYSHNGTGDMCFLTSQARELEPKTVRRSSYFFITNWPKDSVKQEISVNLGTALKPSSPVEVVVGTSKFKLFAQGDKAFLSEVPDSAKLLAAVKKGNFMSIEATSASGATLKDKYSLIGISQGLQNLAKGCD